MWITLLTPFPLLHLLTARAITGQWASLSFEKLWSHTEELFVSLYVGNALHAQTKEENWRMRRRKGMKTVLCSKSSVAFIVNWGPLKEPASVLPESLTSWHLCSNSFISAASLTRQVCAVYPTLAYNLTVIWEAGCVWPGDCVQALLYRLFTCITTWSEY